MGVSERAPRARARGVVGGDGGGCLREGPPRACAGRGSGVAGWVSAKGALACAGASSGPRVAGVGVRERPSARVRGAWLGGRGVGARERGHPRACARGWPAFGDRWVCVSGRGPARGGARAGAVAPAKIGTLSTAVSLETDGSAAVTPAFSADARVQPARRTRWWVEAMAIAWLCWLYDAITNLAPLRLHSALAHGRGILALEQTLHIDPERTLDSWLSAHPTLGLALSDYYDNAHFIVTLGLLGWLWWRRADIYRPLRNTLVLANLLAFIVFWRFPVAPPRMLHGFVDVVASTHALGSWHTGALASQANQLAAMPSLHMAWAGWCALVIWQLTSNRWLRAAGIAHVCVTAFAVLSTGNHYVLDVLAGLLTLGLSWLLVAGAERLRGRRRGGVGARPDTVSEGQVGRLEPAG